MIKSGDSRRFDALSAFLRAITGFLVFGVIEVILGAAVRALGLAGFLDRQEYSRMRVPQVHPRHRAGQRQVP